MFYSGKIKYCRVKSDLLKETRNVSCLLTKAFGFRMAGVVTAQRTGMEVEKLAH